MLDIDREQRIEVLRQACHAYDNANRQLLDKIRQLTQDLADLEGVDAAQIGLDLPEVHFRPETESAGSEAAGTDSEPAAKKPRPPRKGHGPTPQPQLPIQPLHHLFDRVPECSVCGGTMELWVGQCESSEEITVVETSYRILLHQRQKYRCRCNGNVVTAPGPVKLIPGGRYSLDFAVHSAVSKFCDHLFESTHRVGRNEGTESFLGRGGTIPSHRRLGRRQSLYRWLVQAAESAVWARRKLSRSHSSGMECHREIGELQLPHEDRMGERPMEVHPRRAVGIDTGGPIQGKLVPSMDDTDRPPTTFDFDDGFYALPLPPDCALRLTS